MREQGCKDIAEGSLLFFKGRIIVGGNRMGYEFEKAFEYALEVTKKNLRTFVDKYPHVSTDNIYKGEGNNLWTSSFYPGMCYLAYDATGDKEFLCNREVWLKDFRRRLDQNIGINHDLGFLYTLTAIADYKLTGSEAALELANDAAAALAKRYNEKGRYIQAWGGMDLKYPDVRIIIDTMLNLPLLYWTGKKEYIEIAQNHAGTAADYLVREDYSTYHAYLMDPDNGRAMKGITHQGHRDESTWARGQAWAVYGFALSYRHTREERFLEVSKNCAEVFIKNLPSDKVCYWDFDFTDENKDIKDTSAAAIFANGLLELSDIMKNKKDLVATERYLKLAKEVLMSLSMNYTTENIPNTNGVLTEGMYHRNDGFEECTIWGDYFYMEALLKIKKKWNSFWL